MPRITRLYDERKLDTFAAFQAEALNIGLEMLEDVHEQEGENQDALLDELFAPELEW